MRRAAYLAAIATGMWAGVVAPASGQALWKEHFNGIGNGRDQAVAVAVDPASGDAYVTGHADVSAGNFEWVTLKYDSSGVRLWKESYNPSSKGDNEPTTVAVAPGGDVVVAGFAQGGTSGQLYTVIKYTGDGARLWTRQYDSGVVGSSDTPRGLAIDSQGNIYVTGNSKRPTSGTGADYATLAYSSDGTLLWAKRYNGAASGFDEARAIAVDPSSNVYVTGISTNASASQEIVTIKYSSAGDTAWTAHYNAPADGGDGANAIAVDAVGNVYVAGYSTNSFGNESYQTLKYDATGSLVWQARYGGLLGNDDYAVGVAVDASGGVYVTGASYVGRGGDPNDWDFVTIKYTSSGHQSWVQYYDGPAHDDDEPSALAFDAAAGTLAVTGYSTGTDGFYDFATVKYSVDGTRMWIERNSGGVGNDLPAALCLDAAGDVFVCGFTTTSTEGYNFMTIKYAP